MTVLLLNSNILKYFKNSDIQHAICVSNRFPPLALSAWTVSEHYTSFIQTLWLVSTMLAAVHPAQISHSIGLSLTGSLDLLSEALPLLILDLTLGRTTNNSFPQGAQCSIIHTDLPWLQFSFIFSRAEEQKANRLLLMHRTLQQFSQHRSALPLLLFWWIAPHYWFCSLKHKLELSLWLHTLLSDSPTVHGFTYRQTKWHK